MRRTIGRGVLGLAAACAGAMGVACTQMTPGVAGAAARPEPKIAWDWTGIIGTGQSLSVGQNGRPVLSTTQPYHNMKLSTGTLPWPIDPANEALKLVPLVEPIGRSGGGGYPSNINGETPHAAMANEMTARVQEGWQRDFISVHSNVGENGRGMVNIRKNPTVQGTNGRAFEASLIETKAILRLAKAQGKTFGVGAVTVTHGESDAGNAQYEAQLHQLWQDYNTDLAAITGQTQKILMIVSQQNSSGTRSASMIAEWKIGVDYPADIVCSGPKYQFASTDALHLTAAGYQQLGEKYGQVYVERVIAGHDWRPLEPLQATRAGKVLTVQFHVPVGPLVWDTQMSPPHPNTAPWKNGKGFEVISGGGQRVTIDSAEIMGDAVVLTCAEDPGENARVSYAFYSDGQAVKMTKPFNGFRFWGLLRDSDPFKGSVTGKVQPNYGVAFEMTVP